VLHEIRYGIELLPPSRRREAYERYIEEFVLQRYPVLPYDRDAAACHARERARQHALGVKRPYFDGLIAAIALANDLIVVTANVRDFAHYEGLMVENWKR
jgi:tRNA(fMet)-specific endonuclease VapC